MMGPPRIGDSRRRAADEAAAAPCAEVATCMCRSCRAGHGSSTDPTQTSLAGEPLAWCECRACLARRETMSRDPGRLAPTCACDRCALGWAQHLDRAKAEAKLDEGKL